jgi:hypothetical protein
VYISYNLSIYPQDTIHVPTDYATIQEAIDVSIDGDLVLVADGIYIENIIYGGKAVTVASHFIIDGLGSHKENTIIDGSQPSNPNFASVVSFYWGEDSTSVLQGFTITGGEGRNWYNLFLVGGGIYVENSSPMIRDNIIESNVLHSDDQAVAGSAIFIETGIKNNSLIKNNIIINNTAQSSYQQLVSGGSIFIAAIVADSGKIVINNNTISDNVVQGDSLGGRGGGIYVRGSGSPDFILCIENNKILRNEVSAIMPTPTGLEARGGGLWLADVEAKVENNILAFNSAERGGGINIEQFIFPAQCTTLVINNTIYGNTGTIREGAITTFRYYEVINCIVWENIPPQFSADEITFITYSDIEDISYTNGSHNIFLEPQFEDALNGDFHLQDTSPCIGKGIDSIEINFTWRACPHFDIEGNPRPNPAGSMPDIGAYESLHAIPVGVEDNLSVHPTEYALYQNYPNPFNPATKIRYSVPQSSNVVIKIFDILGNEIETFVNQEKQTGTYEITWYAEGLPSGVYFYRLQAGSFVETKKMVLMK